jgi:hypothetical protein
MNQYEWEIAQAEAMIAALQRKVVALSRENEDPLPEQETHLSMRRPHCWDSYDSWGPNSSDRTDFSRSKNRWSRNTKQGKLQRVKPPHKAW